MSADIERSNFYAATLHKSILLVAVTLFYASISLPLIPQGLNSQSLNFLSLMLWPTLAILITSYTLRLFMSERRALTFKPGVFDIKDFALALLPMTPILRFILTNQNILSINESVGIFCLFFLATLVYAYFIPILFSLLWSHLGEFTILGLSFSFSLFMSPYLSSCHYFYQTLLMPLSMAIVFLLCCGVYLFDRKLLRLILCSMAFLSVSVFFFLLPYVNSSYYSNKILLMPFSLAITFITSYGLYIFDRKLLRLMVTVLFLTTLLNAELFEHTRQSVNHADNKKSKIMALGQSRQMISKPDIFLLTYESYVGNETMMMYGIDNSEQESYLTQKGFNVHHGIYSIGQHSTVSMNALLDIGSDEQSAAEATAGNGLVHQVLKKHNYETYGLFSNNYFFWGKPFAYDHCYPKENISKKTNAFEVLTLSILQGEFSCFAGFNNFDYSTFLDHKKRVLISQKQSNPRFIYTHNLFPGHSVYMGKKNVGNEIDLYRSGLKKANEEMRNDIEAILMANPDSIIIINGDHGPYLFPDESDIRSVSRRNIQDRYGVFLAIRSPRNLKLDQASIVVLQDVFPVIFSALFNFEEFIDLRIEPKTLHAEVVAGAYVKNGMIEGGMDNGRKLYESSHISVTDYNETTSSSIQIHDLH